jgi:hypothetical protein
LRASGVTEEQIQLYNFEDPDVYSIGNWKQIYDHIKVKPLPDQVNYLFLDEACIPFRRLVFPTKRNTPKIAGVISLRIRVLYPAPWGAKPLLCSGILPFALRYPVVLPRGSSLLRTRKNL